MTYLLNFQRSRSLRVIARTSVMHYREFAKKIKEIANELGVGVILEGSTRRVGNNVRITAQLIDAETEEHLWADSYDRPYIDIFEIQSDVAQKLLLQCKLNLQRKKCFNRNGTNRKYGSVGILSEGKIFLG
jgi:adenylate cyclase